MWISDRTGHSSLEEMNTYRRNARAFIELKLGDWRPLDGLIPELMPFMGDASQNGQTATLPEQAASDAPAAASPAVPAAPAEAAAAPSRRKARRATAQADSHAVRVAVEETGPHAISGAVGEAAGAVAEGSPAVFAAAGAEVADGAAQEVPQPLVVDAEPPVDAPAEARQPVVAATMEPVEDDAPSTCEGGEAPDDGDLAAAPACTSDDGGWAAYRPGAAENVGGIVGALGGQWFGAGFVSVNNQRGLPLFLGVEYPPTFGPESGPPGTSGCARGPAR